MRSVVLAAAVLLLLATAAPAAFERRWPDGRSAATAGIDLVLCDRLSRTARESEGVGRRIVVRCSGGELYGLAAARGGALSVERESGRTVVRGEVSSLGSPLYRETTLGLAVEQCVGSESVVAVGANALGITADGYEGKWAIGIDAAVARRVLGRFDLLASLENLNEPTIGGDIVARTATCGIVLSMDRLTLGLVSEREAGFEASSALLIEADVTPGARVRAGFATAPTVTSIGCGLGGAPAAPPYIPLVDLALSWHPRLGVSTFVTLTMQFGAERR